MSKLQLSIIGCVLLTGCSPSVEEQAKEKWIRDSIRGSGQYDSITGAIEAQRKMEEMNGIPANKDSLLKTFREHE